MTPEAEELRDFLITLAQRPDQPLEAARASIILAVANSHQGSGNNVAAGTLCKKDIFRQVTAKPAYKPGRGRSGKFVRYEAEIVVGATGIEPVTPAMSSQRSTAASRSVRSVPTSTGGDAKRSTPSMARAVHYRARAIPFSGMPGSAPPAWPLPMPDGPPPCPR